jgi:serine/threonine protein kinase
MYTMPKYRDRKETGFSSEYESDDETLYLPEGLLGQGTKDKVRRFRAADGRTLAITQPIDRSFVSASKKRKKDALDETQAKFNLLSALHPGHVKGMQLKDGTCVLRTPEASGEIYEKIGADGFTEMHKMQLFLSAIQALKIVHGKGFVLIDLKEDNMFYDISTGITTFVDGGMSVQMGRTANERYRCDTAHEAKEGRQKYSYIAPEFFSTSFVRAHSSMDIYALAMMMKRILGEMHGPLVSIIDDCLNPDPTKRPDVNQLEEEVSDLIDLLSEVRTFGI